MSFSLSYVDPHMSQQYDLVGTVLTSTVAVSASVGREHYRLGLEAAQRQSCRISCSLSQLYTSVS